MKFTFHDLETNKVKSYDNWYDYRVSEFREENNYSFWDEEVIEFPVELKKKIIRNLDNNSSKSDKMRVGYIKWIENYIYGIHDFIIQNNWEVPSILEEQKRFIYQTGKKKVGRPKGRSEQTDKRYHWILKKWLHQKKNKLATTYDDHAGLIRSQLKNNKPEFWEGDIYSKETIIDIIKKKKWGE